MQRPHDNTYWASPGRLLAGEYPSAWNERDAGRRLHAYLECGVTDFLDLTCRGELPPYEHLLQEIAAELGVDARYRRIPVRDMDIPDDPGVMHEILGHLDTVVTEARVAYVHCWGGIGRTGTVVGCYFVSTGMTGDAALDRLADLWALVEKSVHYPTSPQTHEQFAYVRRWPA